jgi:hypothetical protein
MSPNQAVIKTNFIPAAAFFYFQRSHNPAMMDFLILGVPATLIKSPFGYH